MARRRRMSRILSRSDKPSTDPDRDDELDGLIVEVLDPTSASEEEEEELDLLAIRRKLAESVGAPVSVCAKIFLHGGEVLFERSSPDHPLVIGRHESSDLVIPENSVSRRHAELTYNDDAWFLRDLDSRSGTKVNGEMVTGLVRLKEGDHIQLGNAVLDVSFSLPSDSDAENEPPSLLDGSLGVQRKRKSSAGTSAVQRKTKSSAGTSAVHRKSKSSAGSSAVQRKAKSSARSPAPGETPVLQDGVPDRESEASTPAVQIAASTEDSADRVAIARLPASGRADDKKRRMDMQDRREIENIKTFGLIGAAIIAIFVIYGIVSSLNTPAKPVPPPPPIKEQVVEKKPVEPEPEPQLSSEPVVAPVEKPATPPVEVVETKSEQPVAPAVDRLPDAPEPLFAERSPFEPRWFAGPGPGTAVTESGETVKGTFLIEGDTVHADVGGQSAKAKLVDMKELRWDGSLEFKDADALLHNGQYAAAAERYAETLRTIEAALRDGGKDPAEYAGRWYVEGRRNECMQKAAHLSYCEAVFSHPELATPEQLNSAGASFVRVATNRGTSKELRGKFEALLKSGKILLSAVDQDRWADLNRCRKPVP